MTVEFKFPFVGADAQVLLSELESFEKKIGYKIPSELKSFLRKTNGGSPHLNVGFDDGEFCRILRFVSFTGMGNIDNGMEYEYEIFSEEMEETDLLPFAFDLDQEPICISLSETEMPGAVVSVKAIDEGHRIYLLGKSFDEFLKNIVLQPSS